jgi:hypothetical protein
MNFIGTTAKASLIFEQVDLLDLHLRLGERLARRRHRAR